MSTNLRNIIKLIVGTLGCFALLLAAQAILTNHNRRMGSDSGEEIYSLAAYRTGCEESR